MKRILTTTALALMLSAPAFADSTTHKFVTDVSDIEVLGSDFIGARVYVVEKDLGDSYTYTTGAETEWDDIGEINELVMTRDGEIKAAVIGWGGLGGIGEKSVAVNMDSIQFIQNGDDASDYFLVFTSSMDELEAAPEWDEQGKVAERVEQRDEKRDMAAAEREEKDSDLAPYRSDMAQLDAVKREGYAMDVAENVKEEELIGARVYGVKGEDVGEISELVDAKGNGRKEAIIDVGGLLGIGEKPVAVSMKELRIMRKEDGDDVVVYIDATQERLENLPEYEM